MNRGVCLPTESSINYKNLLVILYEVSLRTHGEKKQVFQTDFANSWICMMIKNTCIFDEAIQQHSF